MKTLFAPLMKPGLGELRCRCEFLWLPRIIDHEKRWFEMAIWEEVFYYPWKRMRNCDRFWFQNSEEIWREKAKAGERFNWGLLPEWSPTVWINS